MIHYMIVLNRQGKVRLSKWYRSYDADDKRRLGNEIHKAIMQRPKGYTNFVDFHLDKIVYRRYAGLYFCMCVDRTANELSILELIHLYVETLDTYFHSVCELDLVYNFHKCFLIWDELCIGGYPVETSKKQLLRRVELLDLLMKDQGKQKDTIKRNQNQ